MSTDGWKIDGQKDKPIRVVIEKQEIPIAFYIIIGFSILMTILFMINM